LSLLYLDTSALVRLYTREPDYQEVRVQQAKAEADTTHVLTYVEMYAALTGRRNRRLMSERAYQMAMQQFEEDWPDIQHVALDEALLRQSGALARGHGLRAYDAVHLAAAQVLQPLGVTFMTFDLKLRTVAEQVIPGAVWQP